MSRTILGASAAALILGVSAVAIAQSGGDVRSNDRKIEKALDHEKLTPVRPIRRVGPDDWPAGDPNNRADNLNKPKETTGQAAQDSKQEPKQDQAQQQPSEQPKQDLAKQQPPKQQGDQQQPAQNTAQQQQPPAPQPQQARAANQQQNAQPQQPNAPQQKQENFASIRLGTDAQGRVAINDAQEKEISSALRKQRLRPTEVSVKVGAIAPPDVRLGAVSADIVAVLPQFRGYSFFATRDELVIVEPTDKKVVALVPLNGSQIASRPEPERGTDRTKERSAEYATERRDRSASRSSTEANSRRESKRETVGAGIPSAEEILNAPVTGSSGRAQSRVVPDDDTVVIERRPHRRVLGIFRF